MIDAYASLEVAVFLCGQPRRDRGTAPLPPTTCRHTRSGQVRGQALGLGGEMPRLGPPSSSASLWEGANHRGLTITPEWT